MGKRIKIGIIYEYYDLWIGGTYYILNLISALNKQEENEKPLLSIFYVNDEKLDEVKKLNYPFINYYPLIKEPQVYNLLERIINKISYKILHRPLLDKTFYEKEAEVAFPYSPRYYYLSKAKKKVFWIPDFQDRHFPGFFSGEELNNRIIYQEQIIKEGGIKIFSSKNAENDFHKFYPNNHNKTFVVNFAVSLPTLVEIKLNDLLQKFKIPSKYFICCNQFWIHKNHIVVLEALKSLMEQTVDAFIVFTGKEYDYRNPDYFNNLKKIVKDYDLDNYVKFLGFIEREDQLELIKGSIAVIQPSLFEGWSTVVEDSKALNKYIILSGIDVHKEQIDYNVTFFDPYNSAELASAMLKIQEEGAVTINKDYQSNIKKFGADFLVAIKS